MLRVYWWGLGWASSIIQMTDEAASTITTEFTNTHQKQVLRHTQSRSSWNWKHRAQSDRPGWQYCKVTQ